MWLKRTAQHSSTGYRQIGEMVYVSVSAVACGWPGCRALELMSGWPVGGGVAAGQVFAKDPEVLRRQANDFPWFREVGSYVRTDWGRGGGGGGDGGTGSGGVVVLLPQHAERPSCQAEAHLGCDGGWWLVGGPPAHRGHSDPYRDQP